ncbi:MAG: TAXI family TRAP transporter solute-binding subunit [Clostridia bacterium]|nr:TAXI family TRAP transporter solute-binding subunit [Clostridia bacterium]
MKKTISLVLLATLMVFACILTSCSGGTKIVVGTGGPTGTYYAYTSAVGKVLGEQTGMTFNVVSTGGSAANLKGIRDGDYKMAIVQNDTMINAYNNLDPDNFDAAITNFSVLGEVYSEVIQIVVRADLKDSVNSLADLKGLRVSVGDAGSGVYNNAKELLAAYNIDIDKDITQNNLSVGESANAMKDGNLDAFFFTSGAPTTAITELITAMDIFLLSIDEDVMNSFIASHKIDGKYEVYSVMDITNAQYSCIPEDAPVRTIGVTATFIVSNTLSEEEVYNMTKALWEGKDKIATGHVIAKSMDINNATITLGNVPVHPGAAKYSNEVAGK